MNIRSNFIILFVLFASTIFSQTETCLQNLNHPDYRSIIQIASSDTIVREYIMHVPANYDANSATPLIINMHGFGDCASEYIGTVGDFYNFNELADQENILVAYPQGAYRPEKEDTYWEPGDNNSSNIYENDVYFIEQLISAISDEFNVDLDKVFACGYSNGGMMAYSLACNRSDLFSAIGIMSGTMLEEDCNLENPVPIIKFHGIADEVLPYDGNQWYQSVSEVVNFWLDKNDIPASSLINTELNDGKIERDEYLSGNENNCLTLYTVNEEWDKPGDHVWFSEAINGSTPNKIMWDFFNGSCSLINSIDDISEAEMTIKIQPNPFSNRITVVSNQAIGQHFSIHNMQGIQLVSGKINSNQFTIELNSLSPNIYLLYIGNTVRKIIKVK